MEDLKDCPFCGKVPQVGYFEPFDGVGFYSIECGFCELSPGTHDYSDKQQAIKAWNTRWKHKNIGDSFDSFLKEEGIVLSNRKGE
jgi:Lar family restriction alleviation protein